MDGGWWQVCDLLLPICTGVRAEFLMEGDMTELSEACEVTYVKRIPSHKTVPLGAVWKSQISHQERKWKQKTMLALGCPNGHWWLHSAILWWSQSPCHERSTVPLPPLPKCFTFAVSECQQCRRDLDKTEHPIDWKTSKGMLSRKNLSWVLKKIDIQEAGKTLLMRDMACKIRSWKISGLTWSKSQSGLMRTHSSVAVGMRPPREMWTFWYKQGIYCFSMLPSPMILGKDICFPWTVPPSFGISHSTVVTVPMDQHHAKPCTCISSFSSPPP